MIVTVEGFMLFTRLCSYNVDFMINPACQLKLPEAAHLEQLCLGDFATAEAHLSGVVDLLGLRDRTLPDVECRSEYNEWEIADRYFILYVSFGLYLRSAIHQY